jgi:Zn-dependent peptidase ImmA (M78 family)
MVSRGDTYYRGLVETALRAAGYTEPPISPLHVATHLGVPVRTLPLPPWFAGALIYEDGLPAILLNPTRPDEVRRRALGHLLAHLLILIDDPSATYPRDAGGSHPEAELMAEEFEAPGYLIRDQAQKWFNDYRYLAGLFGVTEDRMFSRMRDLGLIKSRGVVWDY